MVDVREGNFAQALENIRQALPEADFVAVDLELTGTKVASEPDSYIDSAEARFDKACRIAESFAPVQLGITICSRGRRLSSFSILMAPESTFLCSLAALKFIRGHGFDLNAWVDTGVRHISREEADLPVDQWPSGDGHLEPAEHLREENWSTTFLCEASRLREERLKGTDLNMLVGDDRSDSVEDEEFRRWNFCSRDRTAAKDTAERKAGLPQLWDLLRKARKPLVTHCGLYDLLFLLVSFEVRVLPRDPLRLAQLIQDCLPAGVYDTAYIHEISYDLRLCKLGLQDFENATREHYERRHGEQLQFTMEAQTEERYGNGRTSQEELIHEAGYDSFLTASLFLHMRDTHAGVLNNKSLNRFYLHRSTDFLPLSVPQPGRRESFFGRKVYNGHQLVVARLTDEDARQNTTTRISEARQNDRERDFFFRRIDEDHLLIPGCDEAKLVQLSKRLPGVHWMGFYDYQPAAQRSRPRPPDMQRQYTGYIKNFMTNKGYGYIKSLECSRVYDNQDVFLHRNQYSCHQEGQHVKFHVQCNEKRQPQARKVEECWFTGVIRTIDFQNGVAFISCPTTYRIHNTDVLLHLNRSRSWQVGDTLHFTATYREGQLSVQRLQEEPVFRETVDLTSLLFQCAVSQPQQDMRAAQ